jgi:CheY-like chemotaxis protein
MTKPSDHSIDFSDTENFGSGPALLEKIHHAFNFAMAIVDKVECVELAKTKVILIADDEPLTFELISEFLRNASLNAKILMADTGRKAYQLAVSEIPDLIITDWIMPEFDGPHLIKKLKTNPLTAHIPVIVTTGAVFPDKDFNKVFDNGAIDYIRKPIDEFELIACVTTALAFPAGWNQVPFTLLTR